MKSLPSLFVGITSWNSELFLPHCIDSIRKTTTDANTHICVIDNLSTDRSALLASQRNVEIVSRKCSQSEALNILLLRSHATYTLLLHADVVLLNPQWFQISLAKLVGKTVLLSPEDIGCGPMTRPFGIGKPESSFMLFHTVSAMRCRRLTWQRKRRIPIPRFDFNFSGDHLTHDIPDVLASHGFDWCPMNVYSSNHSSHSFYTPSETPNVWSDELSYLRYGLGNFYGLDGTITHYHNWYDRVAASNEPSRAAKMSKEFPADFISGYSARFLNDYVSGSVDLPADLSIQRYPIAL